MMQVQVVPVLKLGEKCIRERERERWRERERERERR